MPEVIILQNLHELLNKSSSTRKYFLSLPVEVQMDVHQFNDTIKTAEQLHRYVDTANKITPSLG